VPQGSIPSREKSTVRIAFFTIAAIHVVFIGGLLMQGCKKPEDKPVVEDTSTPPPPLQPMTSDVATQDTSLVPPVTPATTSNVVEHQPDVQPQPEPQPVTAEPGREYVVAKGDSFSTIAKKAHVSVKAIEQANPGVNSSKLKIGQKLQVPASGATTSTLSSPSTTPTDSGDTTTYVVKAGDMLEKIARRYGTTSKAIMRANNMKATMIRPGQKLKIPAAPTSNKDAVAAPGYVTPLPSK
jgi:LysM repeat protein